MILDLAIKFLVTPENVLGLVWSVVTMICMCLIFQAWQEKWWKSLIPFYGTYLIYKNTWKQWKWLFLVEIILDAIGAKCISFSKKHLIENALYSIQNYIETKQLDMDVQIGQLIMCVVLFVVSTAIVFVLKRVTYVKVCSSLVMHHILLKIGTFILPEIGLLITYICFSRKNKVEKAE